VSEAVLRTYLRKIEKASQVGNATEHTYRAALQELIETLFAGVTATNEPKRIKCGAPDFIITQGHIPLGYIEAKDIGMKLDEVEHTEQLKRYLESLPNLILTDYLEFRWYVKGKQERIGRLATLKGKNNLLPDPDGARRDHGDRTGRSRVDQRPFSGTLIDSLRASASSRQKICRPSGRWARSLRSHPSAR